MKISELRIKLNKLKKAELIKVASEFYKLIPKSKKEGTQLANFLDNPNQKVERNTAASTNFDKLSYEIQIFIENARAGNYSSPNRTVPKKERPKWRFAVKKWHKLLTQSGANTEDLQLRFEMLLNLYEVISEAGKHYYFNSDDPFKSSKILQNKFFADVIHQGQEVIGKRDFLPKAIELTTQSFLSEETELYDLVEILITSLPIPELREHALEIIETSLSELHEKLSTFLKKKKRADWYDTRALRYPINSLAELGFHLHISLHQPEMAIQFFKKQVRYDKPDTYMLMLANFLMAQDLLELLQTELELAVAEKIELRRSLTDLLDCLQHDKPLPSYLW